jgi:broad specificity phosphatase PhoE
LRLYILRHAETEFNRLGIIQGSSVDTDINELGSRQAASFFQQYQEVNFDLVVTSALKRTHQTAKPFIDRKIPWLQKAQINEIRWGDHEGQQISPEWDAIWHDVRDAWNNGDLDAHMPGGESATQLNARLNEFLNWLKTRQEKNILVCTHGRTLRGMICLMKQVTLAEMDGVAHANTGCYIMDLKDDQFHFILENNTDHLALMAPAPIVNEPVMATMGHPSEPPPLVKEVDYYVEKGRYVFTAHYHEKRGYCCGSGCRHCPYN